VTYQQVVQGKKHPRAVVTVDVGNLAGHRVPDG
jgi:hypothetical protein